MGKEADVVRRLTDEVFVGGDFSNYDDLVDDKFVDHDAMPGMDDGKQGQREMAEMVVASMSNRKMEMNELAETTDGRIVENWIFLGTHTGDMMGIPPSNQDVRIRGIEIWRVADGKVAEHWGAIDVSDVFEKAGVGPSS
jgi:predicted ester cyclase